VNPTLAAAMRAADRGWRVFPIVERSKKPLVKWQTEASVDPARLRYWWSGPWARANLAAVVPAGCVVIDVDPRHRGDDTLDALEAEHGLLPPTLTAITGSGGQHLWFHVEQPDALRQEANVVGPGVDTRCAGRGFVLLPPSVHPGGGTYQWAAGTKTIADAPAWLVEALTKPPEPNVIPLPQTRGSGGTTDYGRTALAGEMSRLLGSTIGRRNEDLYRSALRAGQLIAGGHLERLEAVVALTGAGLIIGLDGVETKATVESGLRFGFTHPRGA
jgi:hypothetical protein